jgi:tetratricopeptide (TPR) repeat protein
LNVFVRRIEKLSKPNRRALALAALIEPGAEFDLDVLVEILEGEPQQVVAQTILNEALAARLVRQVGEQRYIFHPVDLAETLAAELPEAELPTLHRRLAEILCQKQANPMLIGHHYERAGLPQEAAHYLELAAVNAASTNAVKTAIEYYNRVVDLKDSLSAYKALGNLYRQQGEWNYSLRAFQQALKLAQETNDTLAQAQIMNGMSFTLWLHDNYKEAHKLAEAVLRLANVPESEQAAAHSHLGMIAWLVGELAQAETWCEQSIRVLEQGSDKAHLAGAYNRLGLVHFSQGKLAEAYNLTLRSLKLREQLDDYWGQAYCLVNMGKVVTDQGDFEQAFSLFHSAQKLFEQVNSQDGLMILNASYGRALLFQKRYEEALPYFARARQIALKIGKRTAYGLSYIDLLQAQTYLALGQLETAKTALSEGLNLVQEADNREYIAIGLAIQAQVYAAEGNPALAEEIYHQAMALFEQIGSQTGLLRTWLAYAQFLAQQGQTEKAANLEQNSHAEAAKIGAYLS